jgi:hypothetical protein
VGSLIGGSVSAQGGSNNCNYGPGGGRTEIGRVKSVVGTSTSSSVSDYARVGIEHARVRFGVGEGGEVPGVAGEGCGEEGSSGSSGSSGSEYSGDGKDQEERRAVGKNMGDGVIEERMGKEGEEEERMDSVWREWLRGRGGLCTFDPVEKKLYLTSAVHCFLSASLLSQNSSTLTSLPSLSGKYTFSHNSLLSPRWYVRLASCIPAFPCPLRVLSCDMMFSRPRAFPVACVPPASSET